MDRQQWVEGQVAKRRDEHIGVHITSDEYRTDLHDAMAWADNHQLEDCIGSPVELDNEPQADAHGVVAPTIADIAEVQQAIQHPASASTAGVREALELILPLAIGYVAEHPVGSNQAYVEQARAALAAIRQEGA